MPISIDFLANVTKFLRGTDDMERALEDVADSLDDAARDGDQATERLERSFKDLADTAADSSRKIDREMDQAGGQGLRRLGDTSREVGDELKQNLGESLSSFRGDLADLPQIAQDTLGGLAGSGALGGIAGLAATAAGAAGLGLITGAIQAQQAAAEALREKFKEAYQQAAEDGRTFLDEAQVQALAIETLFNPDARKAAAEDAKAIGVDLLTIVRAQAGDQEALNAVLEITRQKEEEVLAARSADNGMGEQRITENDIQLQQLQDVVRRYEEQLGIQRENEQAARDVQQLQEDGAKKEAENHQRAMDALDERGAKLGEFYGQLANPPKVDIPVNVSTAEAERRLRELTQRAYNIEVGVSYRNGKPVMQ